MVTISGFLDSAILGEAPSLLSWTRAALCGVGLLGRSGVGDPSPSAWFGVGLEGLSLESEPLHDSGLVASLPDGRSIVPTAIDTDPIVVGVDMPEVDRPSTGSN